MLKRIILTSAIISLCAVSLAHGFGGNRKGFVLGGGVGAGPVALTIRGNDRRHDVGMGTNFLIGYAWDNSNMIVYLRDGVIRSEYGTAIYGEYRPVIQGFTGIGWYHYFADQGKSGYMSIGLGLQDLSMLGGDNNALADPGPGILLGGGYEFVKHLQIHGSLSLGTTSQARDRVFSHTQLIIGITAVAY